MFTKFAWFRLLLVVLLNASTVWTTNGAPLTEDASTSNVGRVKRESFDAIGILTRYGYLQRTPSDIKESSTSHESLKEAIRTYQSFNGLEVTGRLDDDTLAKMDSPRCGVADFDPAEVPTLNGQQPSKFTALGSRWEQETITWKPTRYSNKLSEGEQLLSFKKAFDIWKNAIPHNFQYAQYEPDIEIKFASGEHGDGWQNKFDGKGRVLAHAYAPGSGLGGDTHFDEDEYWSVNTGRGSDLTTVAAHEFGHSLGLGHSSVNGALMAPYYRYKGEPSLHADDILGIQSLYGVRPTTTTSTTSEPTTPTTTTEKIPEPEELCKETFRLDAITEGGDGYMYAFRFDKVYKIGADGLQKGYPKDIADVFLDAPRQHIRAASYVPENNKIYMFKDLRVWRFSQVSQGEGQKFHEASLLQDANFELDTGYPKQITVDSYYRPSSAITLTYKGISQLFLFAWDYFWEFDIRSERIVPGYPLSSDTYFPHAPGHPDASFMNRKGNLLFFKFNSFKFLGHRGLDGRNQMLGPNLFGEICGGQPTIFQHSDIAQRTFMEDDVVAYDTPAFMEPSLEEIELSPELWSLVTLRQMEVTMPDMWPRRPGMTPQRRWSNRRRGNGKRNLKRKMGFLRF